MKMESSEALSALDAKRHAEAQMARAATCPPWRHAVFGLLMGALVASPAFDTTIRTTILVLILCCLPIIVHSDRKRTGMFINGYRRGKTLLVTFGILAVELSLYFVSLVRGLEHHDHGTPLLLGALAVAIGIAGSLIWQHVFVREMGL
jgi:uncharacterized membrane protein